MNPRQNTPWSRLAAAARRAPVVATDSPEIVVPAGFATRVVALAGVRPSGGLFAGLAFERLAARALAFSCAGALAVTVWASLPASAEASAVDASAVTDYYLDPVGAVMEAVQS